MDPTPDHTQDVVCESTDVLMPLREGRAISQEVVDALASQGVPYRLWISTLPTDGTADARNHVKRYADTNYALMLDGDTVLPEGGLRQMIDFLDEHADYGAVGLCRHRNRRFYRVEEWLNAHHVDMSCVLFRRETLDRITFADKYNAARVGREKLAGPCECANCCHDIREMGLRIGFVPEVYVEHLNHPPR